MPKIRHDVLMKIYSALLLALAALSAAPSALAQDAERGPGFNYDLPELNDPPPALLSRLTYDSERQAEDFEETRAAEAADFPDNPRIQYWEFRQSWTVTADTGRLIGLSATIYQYSGGAHGNSQFRALLWDRANGGEIEFIELFNNRYAALDYVDGLFCPALAAAQTERMGEPNSGTFWEACPILHTQPIALMAGDGGRIERLVVQLAPYIAGPYAAGSFEIEIPVDAGLLAMIKPEYRDSFSIAN
jgi:hypothetical protein